MIEIRVPTADDYPAMCRQIRESFGRNDPPLMEREKALIDFDRFRIAYDTRARRLVGVSGTWALELTLPGRSQLPMAGTTWVAVSPTHRRRGILTQMMDALHADVSARGEPLAGLLASEGPIYGRFGYSIATYRRITRIDRRFVTYHSAPGGAGDPVFLLTGDDPGLIDHIVPRWDRYRLSRAGEISRTEERQRFFVTNRGEQAIYAFHDDGYACWTVSPDWSTVPPQHELRVEDFAAATDEARDALWATILGADLVGPVVTSHLTIDDPVPLLLSNPRAVRAVGFDDLVWLKVLDVKAVFGLRTYGTDDDLVVSADGVRWKIGAGGCSRTRRRADLTTDTTTLGSLVLGGTSPQTLASARRLEARNDEVLRRANAMFRVYPDPLCQTGF